MWWILMIIMMTTAWRNINITSSPTYWKGRLLSFQVEDLVLDSGLLKCWCDMDAVLLLQVGDLKNFKRWWNNACAIISLCIIWYEWDVKCMYIVNVQWGVKNQNLWDCLYSTRLVFGRHEAHPNILPANLNHHMAWSIN